MKNFEKCKICGVYHAHNSMYGNPRFDIDFLDSNDEFHRAKTASNSLAGYAAENYYYCESGHPIYIRYHYTKGGKCIVDEIKHQHPADAKEEEK